MLNYIDKKKNPDELQANSSITPEAASMISPRLIPCKKAADYCDLCSNSFIKMVDAKIFPPPIKLGNRLVWDIQALDKAIDKLSGLGSSFDPIMEQINAVH